MSQLPANIAATSISPWPPWPPWPEQGSPVDREFEETAGPTATKAFAAASSASLSQSADEAAGSGSNAGPVRVEDLPPEEITRQAVAAFFWCGATLFYVMTEEDADNLVNAIYHGADASAEDIGQVCAVAAIGCQYALSIASEYRELYFNHACALLNQSLENDNINSMRVYICLSMVSVMEKHHRARNLVAYGLKVARSNLLQRLRSSGPDEYEWCRLLRTMTFLEWCVLSQG